MWTKAIFTILLVTVYCQLNAAEQKFENHQQFTRHGVAEFIRATYPSVAKGFDLCENLVKDLRAYEPKTKTDEEALLRLENLYDKIQKTKGTDVTDENMGEKLEVLLSIIVTVREFKTKESEFVFNSPAVKELIKKYNFEEIRQGFLENFKTFADKFEKEVEDFLGYADTDKTADYGDWLKAFKGTDSLQKKLHLFLTLFVNVGQFEN